MVITPRLVLFFVYLLFFLLWVFLCTAPVYLFKLLGARRLERSLVHFVARSWGRHFATLAGARVCLKGLEHVPMQAERLCVVSNHQGQLDILVILGWYPRTVGFIAKKELMVIPVINFWMKILGSVFIDRHNLRKAAKAIEKGVESIRRGNPMAIFPEGTRSRSSQMGAFKPGALKLATRSGSLISPVSVDGTFRVFEEGRRLRVAEVTMTIHPPIDTAGLSDEERRQLPARLEKIIASALPGGGGA
jgi:1-acyl-sn-glycerol-3-phosphate acyltransferase